MEFALVIALAIEALAPPGGTASCPMLVTVFGPVCVVLQFCANAPEPVEITTAKANPARIPPSRAQHHGRLYLRTFRQKCRQLLLEPGERGDGWVQHALLHPRRLDGGLRHRIRPRQELVGQG